MTLTLERHFGGRVALRPLATFLHGPWYFRRVLLAQEYTGRPVEMGAIRIRVAVVSRAHPEADPEERRAARGGCCATAASTTRAGRRVFLSVTPNPEMMGVFWMREPKTLYGRRTEMIHNGVKIGDIVEVLPLV